MSGRVAGSVVVAGVAVSGLVLGGATGPAGGVDGAAGEVLYRTVDLGTLGGDLSSVAALNERGQMTGSSTIAPKRDGQHAFLWDPNRGMRDLGSVGGSESFGEALNERGQVAGWVEAQSGSFTFLWDPVEGIRNLGTVDGSRSTHPVAVNGRGQVAVVTYDPYFWQPDDDYRSLVWDPATGMRDVGNFGGEQTRAVALNERGQVAGWSMTKSGARRAFLWDPVSGMRDLGTLGGDGSAAGALNERGQVAGWAYTTSVHPHAFLWDPVSGMRDLGTLGGDESYGLALNERGQVAGSAQTTSGAEHAFLWDPVSGMRDLGTLGLDESRARALNERGQVAGVAYTKNGEEVHAFLWDPASGMRDLGAAGWFVALNDRGQVAGEAAGVGAVLWTPSSLAPWVSATVAKAGYGNQLRVNVNPNRYLASEYWEFRVQKRTSTGSWTTLPTTYRTQGTAETRTLTLGAGVFRVKVNSRYGYKGATSAAVRLTRPTVKLSARAVGNASWLFVDVDPNKGTGYWTFRIQKRTTRGSWYTLPTTYRTEGAKETKTINLAKGTYRVKVNPKYGYLGTTSAAVRILR